MFGPINKFHHESPVSFKYQGIWLEGKVCFVAYLRSGHFLYDLRTRDEDGRMAYYFGIHEKNLVDVLVSFRYQGEILEGLFIDFNFIPGRGLLYDFVTRDKADRPGYFYGIPRKHVDTTSVNRIT